MAKKTVTGEDGKTYRMKEKKPFYKKIWFWLIAILIVIIAVGSGGSKDKENAKETTQSTTKTSEKSKEKPKEKKKEEAKSYGIGEIVPVGKVEYTINSVNTDTNVGGEYGKNAQGTFLILNITVTNKGDEALHVSDNFFVLKNDGKEYKSDTMAAIYANASGESFFVKEINPDLSLTGNVVFDVSQGVVDSTSKQLQVQTGVFGTEKALINLQ